MGPVAVFKGGGRQDGAAHSCGDQVDGGGVVLYFVMAVQSDTALGQLVVQEHARGHEAADHDQVYALQVGPAHRVAVLQGMRCGAQQRERVFEQHDFFQLGVRIAVDGNAQFGLAVQHGRTHIVRRRIVQAQGVARVALRVSLDELRQHMGGERGHAGQCEVALSGAGLVAQALQRALRVQHQVPRLREEVTACSGQLDLAGGAVQQAGVQQAFEFLDAARERSLCQVQLLGGLDEAAQLGHAHKGLQSVKVDFHGTALRVQACAMAAANAGVSLPCAPIASITASRLGSGATAAAGPIALLAARMGLLEGAGASAAAVLSGPQGIIVAMGIGLATAAVAAAADIVRLNDVLDKFFDQQEKLAQGKQAKGIADLFSNPNGTSQTINQLKAAAAASEEARSQFKGFGKGISTDLQKQLGDINVRALGSATEELDRAFRILGSKTTKDFNRELASLKDAMETVRSQFKAGETDIGALNRATEAYNKKLKELGIETSKAKPLASLFNLGEQEISNRFQTGLQAAAKAVADFILASEPIGTRLPLETAKLGDAYFAVAERIDSSGNRVRSQIVALTDEVDILRQKFSDLNKVSRIDVEINQGKGINIPVNETGQILNRSGQQSQVQLRESARQAGDDLQRIVELRDKGQATQADVLRAQQIYSEAEQRAAGITIQTTRTRISNFQQLTQSIRRSIESISDGIIDVISGAQSIGEVFRGIAFNISQSILKYVINEGLALMGKELAKLGGLLGSLGRQLASIFGNSSAVASAAGSVANTAGAAGSAAGSAAGGVGSAAAGIAGGTILGAVGAISSAVTAVFAGLQFFQGRRMEQDIGRIEVTSRSIFNEVSNIRKDMQAQFDGTFARLGDVWNTLQHIDEGLSGIPFSSSGFKSAQGVTIAGDVVVNDPVGNVDDLMAGISRRLKAKDRAFAAA